ncbi:hypothetical protein ACU8KH_06010 [Lachancea thermotolerans]
MQSGHENRRNLLNFDRWKTVRVRSEVADQVWGVFAAKTSEKSRYSVRLSLKWVFQMACLIYQDRANYSEKNFSLETELGSTVVDSGPSPIT